MNQYQNLKVWQRAKEVAVEHYKLTATFPRHEQFGLTSQLRRSAVSIPSNIGEGAGRNTKGEFIQFLGIATGSAYELETQLFIAYDLSYLDNKTFAKIHQMLQEVTKMLYSFRQHLSSKKSSDDSGKTNDSRLTTND